MSNGKRARTDSEDVSISSATNDASTSTLSRKEQNRISQEKSRSKKAEYVSTLEGEVRLLSYNKEAQTVALLKTIRVILKENARLRTLVGNLSEFIGKGLGGFVSELGLTSENIDAIAKEGYFDTLQRCAAEIDEAAQKAQRESTDPLNGRSEKLAASNDAPARNPYDNAALGARIQATSSHEMADAETNSSYATPSYTGQAEATIVETRPGEGYPQSSSVSDPFAIGLSTSMQSFAAPPLSGTLPPSYNTSTVVPPQDPNVADSTIPPGSLAFEDLIVPGMFQSPQASAIQLPSRGYLEVQAMQLIDYHVQSHRRNPFTLLPAALERTFLQKNVPHDPCIDEILWASVRDRLISLGGNTVIGAPKQVKEDLLTGVTVHPSQDLLDVSTWEVSESFVRKYPSLIDMDILKVCNYWRGCRGEQPLIV